jgi:hypothetical protein
MVKGLAKFGNRLHHDRTVKYVDASTCSCAGRLLPNDGANYTPAPGRRPPIAGRDLQQAHVIGDRHQS